jgi:Flp pilus assembly pilin Flp
MDRVAVAWMYLKPLWDSVQERRRGQGFVEYAFILLFIGVGLTAALVVLQGGISGVYSNITSCFSSVPDTAC